MKKLVITVSIVLVLALFIFWFFYPLRSLIVMSIYSGQQSAQSIMTKNGFAIDMPSGRGWYPFVMTYNAGGFSDWSGIDAEMSIMYNFGAFDAVKRTSSIYDKNSNKYSSFYGAYVLKKSGGTFGFGEGGINMEETTAAVKYDYTQLVLAAFGCDKPVFEVNNFDIKEDTTIAGSRGWTQIDARITASGCAHNFVSDKTPYMQYGPPMDKEEQDFAPISMYGRIYAKHLEEYGCTVMIYVIAPDKNAADECDRGLLSRIILRKL